jgi:NitT/TauT family transport system substrate-binding protein
LKALLGLCVVIATVATARAEAPIVLTTDWSPIGPHAPVFLAERKGWFKDAGLDVTVHDGKGSTTTIQMLAAGSTDVGFVQLASLVAAIDNGMAVTSISGYVRAGDNGFVVPVDSPVREPKDFVGKRVAYPLGGSSAALLDAFWKLVGVDKSQVKLLGVDTSAIASTYIAGNVDAAVSPIASLLPLVQAQRPSRAIAYAQFGMRVPSYGLAVRDADLKTRAADLAKLVQVLGRSWDYIADGHVDEGVDAIIAERPNEKLDRAVMLDQLKENLKLLNTPATQGKPMGWQADSDWTAAVAVLKDAGVVKHDMPIGAYYTNVFFQKN